jgi:hypothetical protein
MTLRFVSHVVMAATLYQVQRFASPARQGNSTNQGKKGALIALLVGFLSQLVRVLRPLAFHVTQGNTLHMWDPLPVMFVGLGLTVMVTEVLSAKIAQLAVFLKVLVLTAQRPVFLVTWGSTLFLALFLALLVTLGLTVIALVALNVLYVMQANSLLMWVQMAHPHAIHVQRAHTLWEVRLHARLARPVNTLLLPMPISHRHAFLVLEAHIR